MLASNVYMDKEVGRIGELSLVEANVDHARMIADSLRMYDARECLIYGLTPLEALLEPFTVKDSRTYAIKFNETVIAMCGTVPVSEGVGRVWMLGTGGVNENYRIFLRGCKPAIDILQGEYEVVENFVPQDHVDTIMWLTWCGFIFDEEVYNIHGHNMMRFVRCRERKNNVYYLERPVMH